MRAKGRARAADGLSELAKRQHGVVSVRQLIGPLGYSRSVVSRAVAAGRLHPLYRGVYAVGHTNIPRYGECLAAVLASGPAALLSHASAAWRWDVATRGPHPLEVTGPNWRKQRPPLVLHSARGLTGADRTLIQAIPVTSLARTLLDCAAVVRFDLLQRYLERSEELRLFDLGAVEGLEARAARHPGKERLLLGLIKGAGLAAPRTNFVEHGHELDLYWPDLRFAVELDLYETHGTRAAFERDRRRQEDLELAGVEMVRVTGWRLEREPDDVIERIARLLAQRAGVGYRD